MKPDLLVEHLLKAVLFTDSSLTPWPGAEAGSSDMEVQEVVKRGGLYELVREVLDDESGTWEPGWNIDREWESDMLWPNMTRVTLEWQCWERRAHLLSDSEMQRLKSGHRHTLSSSSDADNRIFHCSRHQTREQRMRETLIDSDQQGV